MTQLATRPDTSRSRSPRRLPIGWVVAGSLAVGALAPPALTLVVVGGAAEHVITGTALLGFALGWALLAAVSQRWTDQPQRWAWLPAGTLGLSGAGLLLFAPGDRGMTVLGWVWPPLVLALAVHVLRRARRSLHSRTRAWLVTPVCALIALTAGAGALETVRGPDAAMPAAGRLVDVGTHRLYLECAGTGSPTVVLSSGSGEHAASWAWIAPAVARDTRVCRYDRAGTGWSEPAAHPQDAVEVAADLHRLLTTAGEPGPYVLAGHSTGGVYGLVFADRYPADLAGMVLLDSSTPEQFALPGYAAAHDGWRRASALFPSLARLGLGRLAFGTGSTGLPPDAQELEHGISASARDLRGQRDEWAQLPAAFAQAQQLTDLGSAPLLVLTAGEQDPAWLAAQDELAALSSNAAHRVLAGATHADLLLDRDVADLSAQGVREVVQAVRAGAPLRP